MKNIMNNLIIVDLFLDKPKQPCALRVAVAHLQDMDETREQNNDNYNSARLYTVLFNVCINSLFFSKPWILRLSLITFGTVSLFLFFFF